MNLALLVEVIGRVWMQQQADGNMRFKQDATVPAYDFGAGSLRDVIKRDNFCSFRFKGVAVSASVACFLCLRFLFGVMLS